MGGTEEKHRRKKTDGQLTNAPSPKNPVYTPKTETVGKQRSERPPIGKGKKLSPEAKEIVKALDKVDSALDSLDEIDPRSAGGKTLVRAIDTNLMAIELAITSTAQADVKAELEAYYRELRSDADGKLTLETSDTTGFGIVDEGPLCEQADAPGGPGCFLSSKQRDRLIGISFSAAVASSMDNFHAAITNKQLELLTTSEAGWGAVVDFLFTSATGALVGTALKALQKVRALAVAGELVFGDEPLDPGLAKLVGKVSDDKIKGALKGATGKIKQSLQKQFSAVGTSNKGQASFLTLVADQIKPLHQNLVNVAPTQLDDAGMVALAHVYSDAESQSVTAYKAFVDTLLTQYKDSHMAELGNTFAGGGRYELRGSSVVKQHGKGEIGSNGGHGDQREVANDDG